MLKEEARGLPAMCTILDLCILENNFYEILVDENEAVERYTNSPSIAHITHFRGPERQSIAQDLLFSLKAIIAVCIWVHFITISPSACFYLHVILLYFILDVLSGSRGGFKA